MATKSPSTPGSKSTGMNPIESAKLPKLKLPSLGKPSGEVAPKVPRLIKSESKAASMDDKSSERAELSSELSNGMGGGTLAASMSAIVKEQDEKGTSIEMFETMTDVEKKRVPTGNGTKGDKPDSKGSSPKPFSVPPLPPLAGLGVGDKSSKKQEVASNAVKSEKPPSVPPLPPLVTLPSKTSKPSTEVGKVTSIADLPKVSESVKSSSPSDGAKKPLGMDGVKPPSVPGSAKVQGASDGAKKPSGAEVAKPPAIPPAIKSALLAKSESSPKVSAQPVAVITDKASAEANASVGAEDQTYSQETNPRAGRVSAARPSVSAQFSSVSSQKAENSASADEFDPEVMGTLSDFRPSDKDGADSSFVKREEYSDEEVAAVLEADVAPKQTHFSNPQTSPLSDSYEAFNYDAKSVDLEHGLGLPEELEDIINAYDDEIKHSRSRDISRENTIHLAIARILEHAGYEKLAYVRYLKALEANGYSLTAIHELRRIARAYDKTKDVATLLQSELDIDIPKSEQAVYLEEYARIVQYTDEMPDDAIRCLHRAVNLAPDRIGPLAALEHLLVSNQLWPDSCECLNKLAAMSEARDERACFYMMQADIINYRLKQPREAITKYLQTMEECPESLSAFNTVLSLMMQLEHWQLSHKLISTYADSTKDKALTHSVLLLDGSIASDKLGDAQIANVSLERAYNMNTTDPTALNFLLDNFAQNSEHWQQVDEVLSRLEDLATSTKERSEYACLRAVNIYQNDPNDIKSLQEVMEDVYNAYPQNPFLQSMYLELLMKTGQYERVEEISSQMMEKSGTEEASARYTELGIYYKDKLRDYERAIRNFKKALACNPFERRAFENAELIYRERSDWDSLILMYQRRLSVVTDARMRASLLFTLAGFNENVRRYNEAISYYNQYREIYPDDICALHHLQTDYCITNNWLALCETLLIEKEMSPSPAERCMLYIRIAEICVVYLNKKQFAINLLREALEENPQNTDVYRMLCEILSEEHRWLEYVSVLNEVIRYLSSSDEKISTLCKIGMVYEQKLSNDTSAISAYERILKLDPTNIYAIKRLEYIYKKMRNINAYYDLVLRTNPFVASPLARSRRLYIVALKYISVLSDYNSAAEVLENALAISPDYPAAGQLLNVCYLVMRKYDRLLQALHKASPYAKTQDSKAECAFALASIYVWVMDQYSDAVHPLELALALKPSFAQARYLLIQVQGWLHQPAECALLYMEAANASQDKQLAASYYKTAADIAHYLQEESRVNGVDEIGALKRIIEIEPNDIIANERLEAMEPSRANLVPFFEKRLLRATPDDEIELKLSIAEAIYTNQPQKAFALMCEAVEKKPFHLPALRMAANTALKLNNITLAVRYLSMQGKCMENLGMRIIAWKQASYLAQTQLNNPDLAISNIKQAFLLAPHRMDLCDTLVELLAQQHELQEIDNTLQIHVRSISKANRLSRYLQMADFYANELKEPAQAVVKLRQALEIDHDNVETYKKLIDVEMGQQHFHEAGTALESMLEISDLPTDVATNARYQLAELYVMKLHRSRQAISLLQAVLAENAEDEKALKLLAQVYFDESKYQDSLAICIKLNQCLKAPENISTLLLMATIYKNIGDTAHISETLKQAAEIVPLDTVRILNEILPWIQQSDELSVIRSFVETLVAIKDLAPEDQYAVNKFAATVYLDPLNMRFESDKYALAAAQLMPDRLEAHLLAAHVFDPKEATRHAFEAAALAPFSLPPYEALLDVALNSHRLDLQPRVEQQLAFLGDASHLTPSIQASYAAHRPYVYNSMNETILKRLAPPKFNHYIHRLFKLAGPFIVPQQAAPVKYESLNVIPGLAPLVTELMRVFGLDTPNIRLAYGVPFVMGIDREIEGGWCLNGALLQNASDNERRYHIASGLASASLGLTVLDAISYEDISRLATNLIGLVYDQYADPAVLSHIKQVLDRKARRTIAEYVRSVDVPLFNFDPVQQCSALEVIEARAGLLCSADLSASINGMIKRKLPNCGALDLPQQRLMNITKVPVAYSLFQYNLSEEYTEIRNELNIALKINVN